MTNPVLERKRGRELAEELLAMIPTDLTDVAANALFRRLADAVPVELLVASSKVMEDKKAKAFEKSILTFGVHVGKTYADAPIEYLTWLTDSARELQAYLRSDRGQKRIDLAE